MMQRALVAVALAMALAHEPEACDGAEGSECEVGDVLLQANSARKSVQTPEAGGSQASELEKFERFVHALSSAGVSPEKLNQTLQSMLETRVAGNDSAKLNEDDVASWLAHKGFTSDQTRITQEYLHALGDVGMERLKKHAASNVLAMLSEKGLDHLPVGCDYPNNRPYGCPCERDTQCKYDDCRSFKCDCFPNYASVLRADGTSVTVAELRRGDKIIATNEAGERVVDEVAFASLADDDAVQKAFLEVTTSHGAVLTMTAGHHLPVGDTCCTLLVTAGNLQVGDHIWVLSEGDTIVGKQQVVSIRDVVADGLYSPILIGGGFPVVSGIVTAFGPLSDVRAAARWWPMVQRLSSIFGGSNAAARLDNWVECMKDTTWHFWNGGSLRSGPKCPERKFILGAQDAAHPAVFNV
jgi:hypothetical protein